MVIMMIITTIIIVTIVITITIIMMMMTMIIMITKTHFLALDELGTCRTCAWQYFRYAYTAKHRSDDQLLYTCLTSRGVTARTSNAQVCMTSTSAS